MSATGPWPVVPEDPCGGGSLPKGGRHDDLDPLSAVSGERAGDSRLLLGLRQSHPGRGRALAHGPRQDRYGHPLDNFRRIGVHWQAILDLPDPVAPELVALMMACVKVARLTHDPSDPDGADDIEGYVETLRMVLDAE